MVNIAINGFGRIGRIALQHALMNKNINVVAINDLANTETLAHLLKYDSVYGKFQGKVSHSEKHLIINNKQIPVFAEKEPEKLPWKENKVDVVLECTGFFTKKEGAEKHLKAGAKKVIISAPSKDSDATIVLGVNEKSYDPRKHNIISNGSCTTNATAPLAKVLNDNLGVTKGLMVTVHAYTATQKLVDGPGEDLRRARAAAQNIIPTITGAAISVIDVLPELKGKLDGFAMRVPVVCGSIITLYANVKKRASTEKINDLFKKASRKIPTILEYSNEPLVSTDIIRNTHSCIFDSLMTKVVDDLVCVSGWYDNEWGYSARLIDLAKIL